MELLDSLDGLLDSQKKSFPLRVHNLENKTFYIVTSIIWKNLIYKNTLGKMTNKILGNFINLLDIKEIRVQRVYYIPRSPKRSIIRFMIKSNFNVV